MTISKKILLSALAGCAFVGSASAMSFSFAFDSRYWDWDEEVEKQNKIRRLAQEKKKAKSAIFALEGLATKNGEINQDETKKPFNVMSLLPREVRAELEEFATCEVPGLEGRGLSSERLNIEYRVQQKEEEK